MARKMKDSGIEWIGEIPEGWEVSQLKYATRWKSEKGCPDAPVLSLYRDFGVVPKDSRDDNHNVTSLDTSNYKVVDIGDLVINKMKAWQGSMAVSDYRGIVSPAYHVCSITSNKVNKRYLHHLLRNPAYLPEYARLSTGMRIGQWDLGFDDFKNIPFLIPPLDEQAKIADYLDNGCASLNAMLSKTRSSIEEYKKLKQSVITQAVTKGVRGEREMKDSGIEWIGEIPMDWTIQRFARVAEVKSNLVSPDNYLEYPQISPENIEKDSGKLLLPCKTVGEVGIISGNHLFHKGQILYSKIRPKLNKVCIAPFDGLCSADMYPIETNNDTRYIMYCILSDGFLQQVSMITENRVKMPKINQTELSKLLLAMPNFLDEQKEIAAYLDAKCAEIDGLIAKKEQLVKELESYKKSLIYEVVTGKREG